MAINPTPLTPKTKNKMNPLIVMTVLAVFLGMVAALGIWQYLNKAQQQVKELSVTRAVVVANKQISAGAKLSEQDLAIKQLPVHAVPKDYPSSIKLINGRIVKSTIQADEIITEAKLVGKGSAGGMPVVIPPGYRAITVKVNEVVGVGGFINPGDHIDILATVKQDNENYSKTILQNVLILAVGDKILDPNLIPDPLPKVVSQVTVALGPVDSEKLALAQETGQLHLVLRPYGESKVLSTNGIGLEDVYGSIIQKQIPMNSMQPPSLVAAGSSSVIKNSIEVILGDERTYFYY
ncbi:MAG: Flp pilus assembly protein CpaB [Candidatus Melainabacteria bacterium]|nr:Flp pilus assembly protein CpaB [Candidatus Melainabacteria bacterium]